MRAVRAALLAAILLSVPSLLPASAQDAAAERERPTVPVTFYGHVFASGMGQPMPTNTQFPYGEDNLGIGSNDVCIQQETPVSNDCDSNPVNKLVLFSTAGPVDIGSRDEFLGGGGHVQFHNERGSTRDIVLDKAGKITASVFMTLDAHVWFVGGGGNGGALFAPTTTYCTHPNPPDTGCLYPYWGWDPSHWPDWVVRAELHYAVFGDYGSGASEQIPVQEAWQSGQTTLVAAGEVGPVALSNGLPGAPNVHRLDIDLGSPQATVIPKEANFFLVYSWYSRTGDLKYNGQWRLWTGEFFPPSFTLPVKNAFDVELVAPVFLHGKLVIVSSLNTPWGSYDVKPEATRLVIADAAGREITPRAMETVTQYRFAHGAHYTPVNVSYVWDFQRDRLAPGTYTATVSGSNQQGTGVAACTATFEVLSGGGPGNVVVGRCGLEASPSAAPPAGGAPPGPAESRVLAEARAFAASLLR